jgi:hypothetical protein
MAIEMTPEEIQSVFDEYNRAIANGIPVSNELNARLKDASVGIKNYSATLQNSLGQLGQSSKQLGRDLMAGKKGASVFNDSLDKAADAASNMAMGFGPLGIAVGLAVKAFSFFVGAVNKQSDALYKSFQDISRTGSIGTQSMDQVFESMQKLGYTVDELGNMGSVLEQSSKNFGLFSSSVLSGTRQFVDIANVIQNSDLRRQLFNMGLSVDDINKGIAGYINQQGRLGNLEQLTQTEIRRGAVAYIKEMETLTRLTGQQREELEAQREAAMNVDAFYAALSDMPKDAREQALATFNVLSKQNPKLAEEYAANFAGIITGQTDLFLATGGKSMQYASKEFFLAGGQMQDAMAGIQDGLRANLDTIKGVAIVGGKFGTTFKDATQLIGKDFTKGVKEATSSVEDQGAGANATTDAQSRLRDSQIKIAQSAQDLVNIGVSPLTKAMQKLTEVIERLTSFLPGGAGKASRAQAERDYANTGEFAGIGGAASKSVLDKIIQVESGGRNIGNIGGTSSAFGIGQITRGTFEGLAQQAAPGTPLHGKTFEDMKQSVELQRTALGQLTSQNQAALSKSNIAVSDAATYLAHFLGANGAVRVLKAPDNTLLEEVVSPNQLAANINVFGPMRTVSDLKAWADKKMGGGGYGQAVTGAFGFRGQLSGPMSGYMPNLMMHGDEEISIRPTNNAVNNNTNATEGTLSRLIERVDDLIQVSRSQLTVNEKILKYQQ